MHKSWLRLSSFQTSILLSARKFKLEKCWEDEDKIWYSILPKVLSADPTVKYHKIGINKIMDTEICEVEPRGDALWWPKLEPCPKPKTMAGDIPWLSLQFSLWLAR